jgi:hypothetical protein
MSKATPPLSRTPEWRAPDTEQAGLEVTVSISNQLLGSNLGQNTDYSQLLRDFSKHFNSNRMMVQHLDTGHSRFLSDTFPIHHSPISLSVKLCSSNYRQHRQISEVVSLSCVTLRCSLQRNAICSITFR